MRGTKEEYVPDFLKESQSGISIERSPPPPMNPNLGSLTFMQIDADYYTSGYGENEEPIIRMFGVTKEGHSVCAHIHKYVPYFYIPLPASMVLGPTELKKFATELTQALSRGKVVHIEPVQKMSVFHYSKEPRTFLKIYTQLPANVAALKNKLESGVGIGGKYLQSSTYESSIPFALRFMIDMKIMGMSWIEFPRSKYTLRSGEYKLTHCQIEIDTYFPKEIIAHTTESEEYSNIAPLRILSFDIECTNDGKFPTCDINPIITIANTIQIQGEEHPILRNVFTLNSCSSILGTNVIECKTEEELLTKWVEFFVCADPDIVTGYNIINFDIPFIIGRGEALKMKGFSKLGRIIKSISTVKSTTFSSKAMGTRESKEVNMEGRIQMDMMQVILRDHKLASYTLNNVSSHFLGEQKEDVHPSQMNGLFKGDSVTRRRLATYCLKDAYLPLKLMQKLMTIYNNTEMARVTGVPITYLFTRGQQIKVASQLYRKAGDLGMLIPNEKSHGSEGKYEGAFVLNPVKGFYQEPVATLDFASLYPSIMMAHNLCYTTLLTRKQVDEMNPDDYEKTPHGDYFVKSSVKKGILPMILEGLLSARKRAKQQLAKESDPFKKAVLDGRQLALKVSANSVYGFTGAQVGQLPCLQISSSVTAYGRTMIEATRDSAKVIYGDTDSVMVNFGVDSVEEAMELGKEAAMKISKEFVAPIKLEFEKVYYPYLLMNKKRYAGLLWTKPEKYDKLDAKGIETVRRDNCAIVRKLVQTSLDKILIERNVDGALQFCKEFISDLYQNKLDLSLLIITKGLGKKSGGEETKGKTADGKAYVNRQAHVELAEKMKKRDEGSAPSIGDRVAYVMVQGPKGARGYEKAEDPLFALAKGLALDYQYYLDHQLKKPLIRIFKRIIPNAYQALFVGEHIQNKYIAKVGSGGLGKFFASKRLCLGCRAQIKKGAICKNCGDKRRRIFIERKIEANNLQKRFADLWIQCQKCQGNNYEDIICENRDCPIFYRREKARKDMQDAEEIMQRFLDAEEFFNQQSTIVHHLIHSQQLL